jgi:chloride channel protein, CIC family
MSRAPSTPPHSEPAPSRRPKAWLRFLPRIDLGLRKLRHSLMRIVVRFLPSEAQHLFALTLVVGAVCGLVAVAFHMSIHLAESLMIERALSAPGRSWMFWTVFSPTLGGLVAGYVLTRYVPGARGSGIPQVKVAYAQEGGRIRFRDAFGKFWVSSLQIGSGACLGREGPTAQICAGATSLLARLTLLPPKNLRRLTPVGVAAGIAAAFNAPISAVTFTIEEIVGTLDHTVLSGVVVAAAIAAVIERAILGGHPVIAVLTPYSLNHASSLLFYAVLGVGAGGLSILFTDGLLSLRSRFRRSRLPEFLRPAVGGFVTGAIAVVVLEFLGYKTLGLALDGQLPLLALVGLGAAKFFATIFSYSSGGAGGIFAPTLFIGAMLGGAMGYLDVLAFGHESNTIGAFALVGMGAFFAGVIRSPMTSVLIIFEMTGGYGLILPLMLANMSAYTLARKLRPSGIYEALLYQDGVELTSQANPPPLEAKALDLTTRGVPTLLTTHTLAEARARILGSRFQTVPVLNAQNVVTGVIYMDELLAAPPSVELPSLLQPAITVDANAPLSRAMLKMHELETRELVVVEPETRELSGLLSVQDLLQFRARLSEFAGTNPRAYASPNLHPKALMIPAREIAPSTRLLDVVGLRREGDTWAYLVRNDGQFGVILQEHVNEYARDGDLERMLVAADVARPVTAAPDSANLSELVTALGATDDIALVLLDESGAAQGLVSRERLGEVLLQRYASEMSALRA